MSGNFWQSSHAANWLLDHRSLIYGRQYDSYFLIAEDYQKLFIFFANLIQGLSEPLKLRQQVIATATVYFKRFYARNSLQSIDPLLLAPTCILLASKVEEFGVISNSRLLSVCQTVVKTKFSYAYPYEYPYRINHILECEFYLIESMDCCLIVYQPYRALLQYMEDVEGQEDDSLMMMSWKVINDSLRTDVCLLYAPHQIALASIEIACVILHRDLRQWFAELHVDLDKVQEIARYIIDLFEMWSTWNEKEEIKELLAKMPKPRPGPEHPH